MDDLSALLTNARTLNAHIARPDQPVIVRTLEQIENDSRNLVARLPTSDQDGRATYLLARGNVDALGLGRDIAQIDTTATFQPLQPLADDDVQGYLRHVHEQTLISTIEESRKETQAEFYRVMEERLHRDWEDEKKKIFEELGGRTFSLAESSSNPAFSQSTFALPKHQVDPSFVPRGLVHSKMMAYDKVISDLNATRLKGLSFPIVSVLKKATINLNTDESQQISETFHILSKIVDEPAFLPPLEHPAAHALNGPTLERKYARGYLGNPESREATSLRKQIVLGSRRALEEQYEQVVERTLRANPVQAQVGGDPSHINRIRSYVSLRYYKAGRWEDRIELVRGQPEWAKLYFLVRTGHGHDALNHAATIEDSLEQKEPHFVTYFRAWIESGYQRLAPKLRDRLLATYNSQIHHAASADPFKLSLFKLMGKFDPQKRSVPYITTTTEDWMWLQLFMLDDDDSRALDSLGEILVGYGERHFEGEGDAKKGLWSRALLMTGRFELAVAAMYGNPSSQVEAIHLAIALAYYGLLKVPSKNEASEVEIISQLPGSRCSLNLGLLISRYIRHFVRSDPREAMQYVYCLSMNEGLSENLGREQTEFAWDLTRRIIVSSEGTSSWNELVGGVRADGTRFNGTIEQGLALLNITSIKQYHEVILLRAAAQCEMEQRLNEAIKLYNLADAYATVISCLARGLGEYIAEPGGGGADAKSLEAIARDVIRHYDRENRVTGKERDTVIQLLGIREAMDAREKGRLEAALDAIEATEIVPLEGDATAITQKAALFREQDDPISRNLHIILPIIMEVLAALHTKAKGGIYGESSRQSALTALRKKARAVMMFAGTLRYRLSPDVHSYLTRLDVGIAL